MPRCTICDYSNEAPSVYHESSEIPFYGRRTFTKDKKTNDTICSTCEEEITTPASGESFPATQELLEEDFDGD